MPRLPGISQKQAVRVFQKLGYRVVRESGHLIMSNGTSRLVIPRHDPINAITMGAIARDAGLTPEQFHRRIPHRPALHPPRGARLAGAAVRARATQAGWPPRRPHRTRRVSGVCPLRKPRRRTPDGVGESLWRLEREIPAAWLPVMALAV